ncbi:flagellar basal body L-ring protein FlgH [Sulfurimonas sp.]
MIKTIFIPLVSVYAVFFLSGCTAGLMDPEIDFTPPVYVEQMPSKEDKQDFASTGSIFGQGDNPLFSDHKAMHVHDIVRVVISETTSSSNTAAKSLSKSDSTDLNAGVFSGANTGVIGTATSNLNRLSNIGFNAGTTNTFKGSGSDTKDATFTTTVSARIVKVLSNGNYFISGKREILIDEQKQIIQISGVIRPYDIDQYNKISSEQMSEAKIMYKTQGDVDRSTEQGWGTKIVQSVWPF